MNTRQRILAALSGWEMDRIPITELGIWPETHARWIKEGMPENVSVEEYFGLDKIAILPLEASLMLPAITIEENDKYSIATDSNGCTFRHLKNSYGAAEFISSAVKDMDTWVEYRTQLVPDLSRFEAFDRHFGFGHKLPYNMKEQYEAMKRNDTFTVYSPTEPCWFYLRLLGEEESLYNIAANPDFAEQIISDYTKFNINMLDIITAAGYSFDALWVFSDLTYKNGLLFSPKFYREKVLPYQKELFGRAREMGMKIIFHSDGYVGDLVPLLMEAGVDCIQPLEARAGNDVREYMRVYHGKLSFMGNINADTLASGKEAIYREISEKVPAAKLLRRYIYHSDHSIPNTVSLENFKYALELAHQFGRY